MDGPVTWCNFVATNWTCTVCNYRVASCDFATESHDPSTSSRTVQLCSTCWFGRIMRPCSFKVPCWWGWAFRHVCWQLFVSIKALLATITTTTTDISVYNEYYCQEANLMHKNDCRQLAAMKKLNVNNVQLLQPTNYQLTLVQFWTSPWDTAIYIQAKSPRWLACRTNSSPVCIQVCRTESRWRSTAVH